MAPEGGALLLLTLSLGLASAQQTLEEVPVQPDFDAQKVTVLAGWGARLGPGMRTWVPVSWSLPQGAGGQDTGDRGGRGCQAVKA